MSKTVWVTPEVYEQILNNPNCIVVEAQGESPIVLKVIRFPKGYKQNNIKLTRENQSL